MEVKPITPSVPFKACPIQTSLGVLGKKWTMPILRDIGFMKVDRFNHILRVTPGLRPRVLSMRLKELEEEGYISSTSMRSDPPIVKWSLTKKGEDAIPILVSFIEFGSKWYSDKVFADKRPRTFDEFYPGIPYGR